ncbi:MAG: hypothetical protein KDE48_20430, partial [Anaerolineales bacterium]|nr:hypothetical protein [Anaerolineales bacterium]
GTEMLIDGLGAFYPTQNLDHHRMVAFATDENDAVWSAFPTVNTLDGNFQYYYEWTNIINSWDLLKLPVSAQQPAVNMSIDSIPGVQDTVSTDETVQFVANITNMDSAAVSGVQLLISGTAGLTFQTATGAAAFDCSAGSACTIDVPPLALGETDVITVTAVTDSDLSTIDYITTTAYLQADLPLPASDEILIHAVDTDAPIVFIYTNPGSAIGTGIQTVRGRAEDGVGSGVEFVEVSTDGSTWQLATGAQFWQAAITTLSGPTWNLYARATDFHGQTSPVAMVTLIEDTAAPIITATIPSVLRNSSITGFTRDPAPVGARVASVAMQLDDDTAVWQNSTLYQPGAYGFVGQQLWRHIWPLPIEDGVTHTLRFRAVDTAGNVAHSAWFTTMVDIVPPAVTVNQQLTQIAVGSSDPVLAGSVTDGGGFYTATVAIYPAAGGYIEDVVALNGTQWSYTLDQPLGEYTLYLYFKDIAGNTYQLPQHTVDVVDVLPDVVIAPATSSDIELTWTPHGSYCQYNVYRSTSPYVGYALHAEDMASPYTDAGVLGNPALNYFYYVEWIACVGGGTAVTDEVGAFDFAIVPGN